MAVSLNGSEMAVLVDLPAGTMLMAVVHILAFFNMVFFASMKCWSSEGYHMM